jgi:flavin reductase (DIM6/NTAB) family NADH-FMN oxidoreductase RutF
MPVQQGIVGPVPPGREPEVYDKLRRRVLWKMPSGLYVLGSRAGERLNGMTINWVTQLSFDPKLMGVSVEREAFTHELVTEGRVYTVNLIAQEDRAIVRKFTKPVEVDPSAHTLNGFPFHDGVTGAPILDQAVAFLECEVRQAIELGGHTLFLGEIVECGFQLDEATPVLSMGDTRLNYGG